MKKKIKELTKKERNSICSKYLADNNCVECPLYSPYISCNPHDWSDYKQYMERRVKVDD